MLKSFGSVFCRKYLEVSPKIRLRMVPGGWAECGGIYRYRFNFFWYVLNSNFCVSRFILICRSRKTTESEGSSNSHLSFPNEFILFLKWWSVFELGFEFRFEFGFMGVEGFQIQITSSMNRR